MDREKIAPDQYLAGVVARFASVVRERFEPGASRLLARLQKYREEADYSNAFVVDPDGAREELEAARAFVETVRGQMKSRPGRPRSQ